MDGFDSANRLAYGATKVEALADGDLTNVVSAIVGKLKKSLVT